ncbi:chromophore lyase CpcT/CpeT [Aquimarina sp. RZ0]|uniref:chromophore lyase CpcT/CpeT n=1 Tax=Aquimarina sp. RZ0 TaxID=2607730 RepID=UPI0011F0F792|nr:chromophore lyase CpcT/CpeT [Aquimarina sp. RZ0]KAA1245755.1 hypothetical protein F0000_10975 [Aquimarina sp. RZ0]
MKRLLMFFTSIVCMLGCESNINYDPELHHFVNLLSGEFSSKKQADKEAGYLEIHLTNAPIWKEQQDYWFYQEFYDPSDTEKVYYQRILRIKRMDSLTIRSTNYTLPDRKKYLNGWKDLSVFNNLSIDSIKIRDGCDVYFRKKTSSIYQGKTNNGTCLSKFRANMAYTTSHIVITHHKISSWDRGYDTDRKQVWGKIQGPYIYEKISEN